MEGVCFVEGYKSLGFHESIFSEFLIQLRENAPLLAACLAAGEKLSPDAVPTVISVVTSGLYANFLLGDDEKFCLQLLKQLMELQVVSSDNPRRYESKVVCLLFFSNLNHESTFSSLISQDCCVTEVVHSAACTKLLPRASSPPRFS